MTSGTADRARDPRRALLERLGFSDLQHDSHVPFTAHLNGTSRLLRSWGERDSLCDAGLLHSAYGTEYFELDRPAQREVVRDVIGDDAEEIVWLWCTIARDSLDGRNRTVLDRRDGQSIALSGRHVSDLATLWAADTVEQIGRMSPGEAGFAAGLDSVLPFASAPARRAVAQLAPDTRPGREQ